MPLFEWRGCDVRNFLALPGVIDSMTWITSEAGRDRSLTLEVQLHRLSDVHALLGQTLPACAWRSPEPLPTLVTRKRRRRSAHDDEYFVLTGGVQDKQRTSGAPLWQASVRYSLEQRVLELRVHVGRFTHDRAHSGGSSVGPVPAARPYFDVRFGKHVAQEPGKDDVDAHMVVRYGFARCNDME